MFTVVVFGIMGGGDRGGILIISFSGCTCHSAVEWYPGIAA